MRSLLALTLLLVACKDKDNAPPPAPAPMVASTPATISGPSIKPVITNNITFAVPAATSVWGEMSFACYRAVMMLQGGTPEKAGEAFEQISPAVPPAMKAAEINLGRDLQAIGGFDCGDGSPCFYVAARLAKPEKLEDALAVLVPGATPKKAGPLHFTTEAAGVAGSRIIHVRAVPIEWPVQVPGDAYAQEQRAATHVVFIGGVDGKNIDVDPLTRLADAAAARTTVTASEELLADTQNRCIVGRVAPRDFLPPFKLALGRFALGVPRAKVADPMLALLGSSKTFDLQVDLALDPAPKPTDVTAWIDMGRAWIAQVGAGVRGQFAGANPDAAMNAYFEMLSMVGERGFRHELKDKALRLSWRTDRIPASDLAAIEAKLQALTAPAPN